ncbi:tRNA wybutosine-synthesizing protein 4 [Galdieria sulphuraria]|nr:tRNA wybutosine-synthesizing protein 4 [Galdieria sulphuraria]
MNNFSLEEQQRAIQQTNDDAAISKYCAVSKGYYNDPFISLFVKTKEKRQPLINRGTYARVQAVQLLVERFLHLTKRYGKRQVINLGAGFDTLFFRLRDKEVIWKGDVFVELDFPEVTQMKLRVFRQHAALYSLLTKDTDMKSFQETQDGLSCDIYKLIGVDLQQIEKIILFIGTNLSIINSCSNVGYIGMCPYLHRTSKCRSNHSIFLKDVFFISFILFELTFPTDPFGRQMVKNIEQRGFSLESLLSYPSLRAQKERFIQFGYPKVDIKSMYTIYEDVLAVEEKRRIERLELLDELEEWKLLLQHYFLLYCLKLDMLQESEADELWNSFRFISKRCEEDYLS